MVVKTSKTPKQLAKDMRVKIDAAFKDKSLWDSVGKEGVGFIRANLSLGKGVNGVQGPVKKLANVSPQYAKYRKPTSSLAPKRGFKSKLIASGKMFADMSWTALNFSAKIGFKTKRSAIIAKAHDKDGVGKSKVLRPFFNLSKAQMNLINRLMKKFIDRNL